MIICKIYVTSVSITEKKKKKFRYQLFCARRGEIESSQLSPSEDCLFMHDLRANYQAVIWRRCLQSEPFLPNPIDCEE
uniref:Uncharacterized protein n=1 Tax=Octopus bimaculoides TaxID=37653 RepID=A0A0L8H5W8_OCTBM